MNRLFKNGQPTELKLGDILFIHRTMPGCRIMRGDEKLTYDHSNVRSIGSGPTDEDPRTEREARIHLWTHISNLTEDKIPTVTAMHTPTEYGFRLDDLQPNTSPRISISLKSS